MKFQQLFEEGTTSRKDNFVSLDALIFTGQGDISEVSVTPQLCKRPLHKLQAHPSACHNARLFRYWTQWVVFSKIF